ncbi:hypothetical protein MGG_17234 [Pyricularia oryzae 70-15]|uniref:Uncharacterized protein n=3 Tax=Pyricularia oryzae TaxID=318829 RepID=G4N923_PYRO7|nr:uncharacterized protein MGG_17234 [Pyricularia oryzae 70-15]EHA51118.1 hypothetical protein MGG_17234 [Pyricularia oryzae 70-15]ELQ33898.1 hypothetical protein OOU_Y34scaffold00851g5 [Pyricularia oryzae Y34]
MNEQLRQIIGSTWHGSHTPSRPVEQRSRHTGEDPQAVPLLLHTICHGHWALAAARARPERRPRDACQRRRPPERRLRTPELATSQGRKLYQSKPTHQHVLEGVPTARRSARVARAPLSKRRSWIVCAAA